MSVPAAHFENAERQRQAVELGMWVFLATELMFFGPLFLGYAYGRWSFPAGFAAASRHTDVLLGTINTAVLLTSSVFVALGVRAARLDQPRSTRLFLLCAAALGVVFLALKGLEYDHEWLEHLVPWEDFRFEAPHQRAAAFFYFLYFGMTGLHAVHLTIGIVVMGVLALRACSLAESRNQIEMGALYWHFVDAVWVVLYPILYLVERHG